jgi:hypothetical protein
MLTKIYKQECASISDVLKTSLSKYQFSIKNEEMVVIGRVYNEEDYILNLHISNISKFLILSRHHDGLVREKYLKKLIPHKNDLLIAAFITLLLSEYVVEISQIIYDNIDQGLLNNISIIFSENPKFMNYINSRVVSYWNEYYRHPFPSLNDYPSYKIMQLVRQTKNM